MYIYTGLPTKNKTLDTNVRITKFVHLITGWLFKNANLFWL